MQGGFSLADGVELADERAQGGIFVLVDLPDGGAQLVVVVRLVPFRAAFRAVIDARDARHPVQDAVHGGKFAPVFQRGAGARHVVIVDEAEQVLARVQTPRLTAEQAFEGMLDLEQVVRIEGGGEALVALVVGDGIQAVTGQILLEILVVDDLPHQEEVVAAAADDAAQPLEEPFGQQIGDVQAEAVDAEFIHPILHRAADVAEHGFVLEIELDELHMPLPALVPKAVVVGGVAAEVDVEPVLFVRIFPLFAHFFKGEKAAADVVEHAVQHDADARLVKLGDQPLEILVVAEAAVDSEKIHRVIAVPLALEERVEQHGVEAAVADIRDLLLDPRKAVAHFAKVVFPLGAAIAERIDLIKDAFVKPHFRQFSCCRIEGPQPSYYYTTDPPPRQDPIFQNREISKRAGRGRDGAQAERGGAAGGARRRSAAAQRAGRGGWARRVGRGHTFIRRAGIKKRTAPLRDSPPADPTEN